MDSRQQIAYGSMVRHSSLLVLCPQDQCYLSGPRNCCLYRRPVLVGQSGECRPWGFRDPERTPDPVAYKLDRLFDGPSSFFFPICNLQMIVMTQRAVSG